MPKRTLVLVAATGLLALVLVVLDRSLEPAAEPEAVSDRVVPPAEAPDPVNGSRAPVPSVPAPTATAAIPPPAPGSIWQALSQAPADAPPPIDPDLKDQVLVGFDVERLSSLAAGERFSFLIPQEQRTAEVWVESVERLASGNLSIKGAIDGQQPYSFVMTIGRTSVFATFGTPSGTYNLRGNTAYGWIASTRAMREQFSPTRPDYRVPEPASPPGGI
ncbi:MAG: hypothetical protein ACFHX7_06365 [Pseudomonadota bacterium]